MSSHGRTEDCPICKKEMNVYDSDYPVDNISMRCDYCGFQGEMKYDMNGEIDVDITADQGKNFLNRFEEVFNELSTEEKEKYIKDIIIQNEEKISDTQTKKD